MAQILVPQARARRILDHLWTKPGQSYAAFGGQHLLRRAATEPSKRKTKLQPQDVQNYMSQEPAYTRHAPRRHRFPKSFYNMVQLYHLVEADLIEVGRIAHFNDEIRYLMIAIECTSRKIFVRPMLNKDGKSSTEAFRYLLDHEFTSIPHTLRTDMGSEWRDRRLQQLLTERGIRHVFAVNTEKAAMVERAIQTLQRRIHRYLTYNNTLRFLPVLQDLIKSINDSPHASTGVPPNEFTQEHVYPAWERYYLAHRLPSRAYKYKPGDTVRVSLARHDGLQKSYRGTYTPQIFTVASRRHGQPHTYQLINSEAIPYTGQFFEEELISAKDRPDQEYMIDQVLDHRISPVTKGKEMKVTWEGWPKSVQSWIPERAVNTTTRAQPQRSRAKKR